jgi:hypothetical protein
MHAKYEPISKFIKFNNLVKYKRTILGIVQVLSALKKSFS